jgi:hypothetical protein
VLDGSYAGPSITLSKNPIDRPVMKIKISQETIGCFFKMLLKLNIRVRFAPSIALG